jgi:hypothetical protein
MFTPFAFVKQEAAPAPGYQPLTTAFAAASGISDATTLDSLNAFELGLAAYSIATSSFDGIYPFVGASSGSFKWNFVNTTKFNLTYTGSLSFTTGGFAAAGSPKDGRAGSVSFRNISTASYCSFYYLTEYVANAGSFESPIGANPDYTTGPGTLTQYYLQWNGSTQLVHPCNVATGDGNGSINGGYTQMSSKGSYALSRTSTGDLRAYVNGTQSGATNTTVLSNRNYAAGPDQPLHILSRQNNSATTTQSRLGWASVGPGLDSTQMANYHTLVANFQTSMSRA